MSSSTACLLLDDGLEGLSGGAVNADRDAAPATDATSDVPIPDEASFASPLEPLQVGGDPSSSVFVEVAGRFRIDFRKDQAFLPTTWSSLTNAQPFVAAGSPGDLPFVDGAFVDWNDWQRARSGVANPLEILEKNEARSILRSTSVKTISNGTLHFEHTTSIYASGRIGVDARVVNKGSQPETINRSEYAHTNVTKASSANWKIDELGAGHGLFFTTSTSNANVLTIDEGNAPGIGANNPTNRYFDGPGATLPPNGELRWSWQLRIAPDGLSIAGASACVDELWLVPLEGLSGATVADVSSLSRVATRLTAIAGPEVRWSFSSARVWRDPIIVIDGWSSPSWVLTRSDNEAVAILASDNLRSSRWLASHDPTAARLVLVHVGEIEKDLGAPQRSYRLRAR